ncbi:MAG: succinate dehydrogenase, cytochrome b556 subunit [Pseudomonadota bacterium]|jgi:succinate dehydrogenase / fumarate reductase cytochrome b subunit
MSETSKPGERAAKPEFTNIHVTDLMNYRLPAAGFVSILHRISGFLLFLALPFILYLFQQSLTSEDTFAYLQGFLSNLWVKLVVLALFWGYIQHFCSGIRHLIMDNHIGLDKESAKQSAIVVLAASVILTLLVAIKLFSGAQ